MGLDEEAMTLVEIIDPKRTFLGGTLAKRSRTSEND